MPWNASNFPVVPFGARRPREDGGDEAEAHYLLAETGRQAFPPGAPGLCDFAGGGGPTAGVSSFPAFPVFPAFFREGGVLRAVFWRRWCAADTLMAFRPARPAVPLRGTLPKTISDHLRRQPPQTDDLWEQRIGCRCPATPHSSLFPGERGERILPGVRIAPPDGTPGFRHIFKTEAHLSSWAGHPVPRVPRVPRIFQREGYCAVLWRRWCAADTQMPFWPSRPAVPLRGTLPKNASKALRAASAHHLLPQREELVKPMSTKTKK